MSFKKFPCAAEDGSSSLKVQCLRTDMRECERGVAALSADIAGLHAAHSADIAELRAAHAADIAGLRADIASLMRPHDLLWMRQAAATIFHSVAASVMGWDAETAARVDTLAQLRVAVAERADSSERGAALERRLAELGLTPAREEAVARVQRLSGSAAADCDLLDGGELSDAEFCAAFEAKAAAVLPATVRSFAPDSLVRVTADDGREVARLLRLVLL